MIHVVAVITAKPGQRAALLEAFAANRANVLAEKGCIEYFATMDAAGLPPSKGSFGEDTFVVLEKWEDMAALQAHGA
ncbi:MAG: antibiotic biosynthesis monooxygenase, partial [Comamonadaceae bacterium]